jgi:putative ABC transport system ATP-binding protein
MIELVRVSRVHRVGDQEVHALREVDLAIQRGEYLSVMGPSGSGKSTLLNILGLLDRPTSGRHVLDGEDVAQLDDARQAQLRREKFGFVFQFFHLVPRLTAAANIELPLVLAGTPAPERRRRVEAALRAFGLLDRGRHRPDQLSGGQRQRTAIARATILEPAMLLADEPTGNLDRGSGKEVLSLLEDLHGRGIGLVIVTHDPDIGARAPRQVRVLDGRIQEARPPGGGA